MSCVTWQATGAAQQSINFQSGNVGAPNEAASSHIAYAKVMQLCMALVSVLSLWDGIPAFAKQPADTPTLMLLGTVRRSGGLPGCTGLLFCSSLDSRLFLCPPRVTKASWRLLKPVLE